MHFFLEAEPYAEKQNDHEANIREREKVERRL
jgi:hypothetical protein